MKSERLIARANNNRGGGGGAPAGYGSRSKRGKGGRHRSNVGYWACDGLSSAAIYGWARRHYGGSVGIGFLAWRVWQRLGITHYVKSGYRRVKTIGDTVEEASELYETISDMSETGELGAIIFGAALVILLCFLLHFHGDNDHASSARRAGCNPIYSRRTKNGVSCSVRSVWSCAAE